MSTTTVAAPDLSHLPEEDHANIRVAVTQGWRWMHSRNVWVLRNDQGLTGYVLHGNGDVGGNGPLPPLPDYLNDPAAWGPLMQREFCAWESDERGHRVKWWDDPVFTSTGPRRNGPWAPTLPEAIILGTLKKHGLEGYT